MKNFIKWFGIAFGLLVLVGCQSSEEIQAQQEVYKKGHNGNLANYYCENGFLVLRSLSCVPISGKCSEYVAIQENDAHVATRCTDSVNILVRETVATGSVFGSVN